MMNDIMITCPLFVSHLEGGDGGSVTSIGSIAPLVLAEAARQRRYNTTLKGIIGSM